MNEPQQFPYSATQHFIRGANGKLFLVKPNEQGQIDTKLFAKIIANLNFLEYNFQTWQVGHG